jgi:tetratricopeptide (TPR) repeat protein
VKNYSEAIGRTPPELLALRVKRVEANLAMMEIRAARQEAEALAAEPELGDLAGKVLLLRGGLDLMSGKASGAELVRRALGERLLPADQAMAHAMLADNARSQLTHAEEVLQHEPFNHAAHRVKLGALLLAGRVEDFEQHVATMQVLFPEDHSAGMIDVVWNSFAGRREKAVAGLKGLEDRLSAEQLANFKELIDAISDMADQLRRDDAASIFAAAAKALIGLPRLATAARKMRQSMPDQDLAAMFQLPSLRGVIAELQKANMNVLMGRHEAAAESLRRVLERVETPELHGMCGMETSKAASKYRQSEPERWLAGLREAESSFRRALELPALLGDSLRPAFVHLAADTQTAIAVNTQPPDEIMVKRAIDNLRTMEAMLADPHQPGIGRIKGPSLEQLTVAAMHLGQLSLARAFAAYWEQEEPGSARAASWRANVELEAGAYWSAYQAATRALEHAPDDPEAQALQNRVIETLRAEGLIFEKPHPPTPGG